MAITASNFPPPTVWHNGNIPGGDITAKTKHHFAFPGQFPLAQNMCPAMANPR